MSIQTYTTFAGTAGDILDVPGQVGATFTTHPAHTASAGLTEWMLTGTGTVHRPGSTYAIRAVVLASGDPGAGDHDVRATFLHKTSISGIDKTEGLVLLSNPTAATYWLLVYRGYEGYWSLVRIVADSEAESFGTYADVLGTDVVREVLAEVRIVTGTATVTVKIDGVTRITGSATVPSGNQRIGLYSYGTPYGSNTTGLHIDRLIVGSAGFAVPDYDISGPATCPPGAESTAFTVTLGTGVNPGSITITPSAAGLTGTFTPTTVALADATRSATFTFTPNFAGGSGTISVTDSSTLVDPPAMAFVSALVAPARLAAWQSFLPDRHAGGTNPYVAGTGTAPNASEHYDVLLCMIQARDYCVNAGLPTTDWTVEIAAAVVRWRDRYVNASGAVPGYHINATGMARHYYETGEAADLAGVAITTLSYDTFTDAKFRDQYRHMGVVRETAFLLLAAIDREWAGMGEYAITDAIAAKCLEHIDQWLAPAGTFHGIWCKPWMAGLTMRSLIAYWDRYLDATETVRAATVAAIPAKIKLFLAHAWDNFWYPAGTSVDMGGVNGFWDHGAIGYNYPDATDSSLQNITGLTVQTSSDNWHLTGPSSLSTVNDYYKYCAVDAFGDTWQITAYDGATRGITLSTYYGTPPLWAPGDPFVIGVSSVESGALPWPSPALNHMVAPAYAWAYWHTKVVLADTAGSIGYRVKHDAMFDGGAQSWAVANTQKEWNQSLLWTAFGLDWRSRGDSEWATATVVTLQAPFTGAAGAASVESGPFRLSIPHGVKLAAPEALNPACSTGLGTFDPDSPLVVLTTDRPWAPFTFTPNVADDASVVNVSAAPATLAADAPVAYTVGTIVSPTITLYPIRYFASGGLMLRTKS